MSSIKIFIAVAFFAFLGSFAYWLGFFPPSPTTIVPPKMEDETKITQQLPSRLEQGTTETVIEDKTPEVVDRSQAAIIENVPFTVQAPFSEWSDPRFQDACEEASVLMAMKWLEGKNINSRAEAKAEILAIIDWEIQNYGNFHDTSAKDTMDRLFKKYYNYENVSVESDISDLDIISELQKGNLVVTPMNGQLLNNPFFTHPGPERHMVVVTGFDPVKNEFITNDPGISQGKSYRYPVNVFINAIRDYPTGNHQPIIEEVKTALIVAKNP